MSSNDRQRNKQLGYVIAGKRLRGDEHKDTRKQLFAAGGVFDSDSTCWICPSREVYVQFLAKLGLKEATSDLPRPPVVAPPAGLPKVELVVQAQPKQPVEKPVEKPITIEPTTTTAPLASMTPPSTSTTTPSTTTVPLAPLAKRRILELPPSFIVIQEVKVKGDISYRRLEEESSSSEDADGTTITKTTKKIETVVCDPEEYEKAMVLSGQFRAALRKLGQVLQSGVVIVPTAKEEELDKLISDTQGEALLYNRQAKHHYIRTAMLKSLITGDAEAASRGIAYKLQETMAELRLALEQCDVKRIRSIADSAKTLTRIIPAREANTLSAALASAKQTAKWIRDELEEKGKQIEAVRMEVAKASFGPIDAARASFLELSGPLELNGTIEVGAERFAAMDSTEPVAVDVDVVVSANRFDM